MSESSFIQEFKDRFTTGEIDRDHKYPGAYGYMNPRGLAYDGLKVGCVAIERHPDWLKGFVQLSYFCIYEQRRGVGSKIMTEICKMADRHHVTIFLDALPQGPGINRISHAALKGWYQRFGFVLSAVEGSNDMERQPHI